MSKQIFINYRRTLNPKDAQLLFKTLERQFGAGRVFLDVKGLEGGDHWLHTLERQVDASIAMISIIGHGWADVRDDEGKNRRLDNPNDFVRFEIARAFSRKIPVLPVLVDGAAMPDISVLPPNLVELTFPQAMRLRNESFDEDAEKIAKRLKLLIAGAKPRGVSTRRAGALAAVGLATGVAGGVVAGPWTLSQLGLPFLGVTLDGDPAMVARLRQQVAGAEATAGRAATAQQAAERTVETAEAQRRALAERTAAAEKERDERRAALASAQSAASDAQQRLSGLLQERDDQKAELAKAVARVTSAEREVAGAKAAQERVEKLRQEQQLGFSAAEAKLKADLQTANTTLQSAVSEGARVSAKLKQVEMERDGVRSQFNALKSDARELGDAKILERSEAEKRLATVTKDRDERQAALVAAIKSRDEAIAAGKDVAEKFETERRGLAEKLAAAEKAREPKTAVPNENSQATLSKRKSDPRSLIPPGPEGDALRRFFQDLPKEFGGEEKSASLEMKLDDAKPKRSPDCPAVADNSNSIYDAIFTDTLVSWFFDLGISVKCKPIRSGGLEITMLTDSSDANARDVRVGDLIVWVNGTIILNPKQMAELLAVAKAAGRPAVLLTLKRGDQGRVVLVRFTDAVTK
jgi:hypothetical protein